jgi:hypothetical protein
MWGHIGALPHRIDPLRLKALDLTKDLTPHSLLSYYCNLDNLRSGGMSRIALKKRTFMPTQMEKVGLLHN